MRAVTMSCGSWAWRDAISPISMAHDIIHADTGPLLKVGKRTYATQSEAEQRLSFFSNAIVADPQLRDPAHGDFRLKPDSPAIDAGIVIPGVNDARYEGDAPDIGALECGGAE